MAAKLNATSMKATVQRSPGAESVGSAPRTTDNGKGIIDVAQHPGGPWIAHSQSGITCGIGGRGENRQGKVGRWWRPDGSPLAEHPYDRLGLFVQRRRFDLP